ncbi:ATP-dependent DNA helicase DDX11 [Selaginella moellendorffii]|uniref:ATP-dependent DNA helicase DDX11 n=1 Tax=Selaginella moellendorffii TaxID=88036 RepID=UPI000D1C715A|nr:ATP-dependent DNA helicase DDX11 [Selaginella moellendorffii]|eukprot:XP_024543669.1 ATP-dependent DNA helicase DDX11 [Selaginella moellendorffii]
MAREEFPAFPFQPYAIQLQLMRAVYGALEKGGVAIVESPTGTGKTLSLICSVLQWLEDRGSDSSRGGDDKDSDEPEWMKEFSTKRDKPVDTKAKVVKKKCGDFFGTPDDSSPQRRQRDSHRKSKSLQAAVEDEDDEEFLLEDYSSDGGGITTMKRKPGGAYSDSSDSDEDEEGDEVEAVPLKIFFCSRTHSQLSQFIRELKRTSFSTSLKTVALGSRKTLCVNQDVLKLGSASRINDRCLDLQKKKKSSSQKVDDQRMIKSKTSACPFLKKQRQRKQFKEAVVASQPMDIEDLVHLGQKLGSCPYYGSRNSLPMAQVVVLPYQSLLHAATRESLGINLKDSVVIFDEAHNLVDTVTNTYSSQLSTLQLRQVSSQLSEYLSRFRTRLAPANRRYIQTLLVLVQALLERLMSVGSREKEPGVQDVQTPAAITTINDFVFSLGIDNINLFKLCRYIKESNIVNKVSGYGDKYLSQQNELTPSSTAGFHPLAAFLVSLTTAQSDGRVLIVESSDGECMFKFLMLDAAKHFSEVVQQARTVILAGGTLQPVAELRDRLLFQVPDESLHFFSCGHIVPGESILPLAIAKGPSGKTFDFTYQSRSSPQMIEELGRLLINISVIVPEGIVVFFPSFEYESQVHKCWDKSGILSSILKKKNIFREPRNASAVEAVLQEYKTSITTGGGALLLSVVGGKMSEGINFSDGMGRCVVMVGLPYPSSRDPELLEKIKYIDELNNTKNRKESSSPPSQQRTGFTLQQCGHRGRDYYENLCIKAVNQSIGRAIRHAKDYAAILLLDGRYVTTGGPAAKLPEWIKEHLVVVRGGFGEAHRLLHRFFKHNHR